MIEPISIDVGIAKAEQAGPLRERLARAVDDLMASLPAPERLCPAERRGIIARYCAVLEGNFIYWMTSAYLAARTDEARSIIQDNLFEEVRDCHPGMLRKFVIASHCIPDSSDAMAIYPELTKVRRFVGRLSPVPIIAMMAFFEDFIRRFMPYLAELARRQGSDEFEYTTVHGISDIMHTRELFRALDAEMAARVKSRRSGDESLSEGVRLLHALIGTIVAGSAAQGAGHDGDGTTRPQERPSLRRPTKSEGAPGKHVPAGGG